MVEPWKDWNLKDLIYIGTLLVGIGSTYATLTSRITDLETFKKDIRIEINSLMKEHQSTYNKVALAETIVSRLDGDVKVTRETNARTFEVITTIQINMAEIKQELRSIRDLVRNEPRFGLAPKRQ